MATRDTIAVKSWTDEQGTRHVNDIYLSSGQIAMASGEAADRTVIECALRTRRGELPLDTGQGIPYFETVFSSPRLAPEFEDAVRKRILEFGFVDGVSGVKLDFDMARGVLSFTAGVRTTDGASVEVSAGTGEAAP